MVTTPISLLEADLLYPSSDGQPMAENTKQYRWIVLIKENLEILFQNQPNVFIAGDLLWYPIPTATPPAPSQAPDVMVVIGRPKGDRLSYKQWEENNVAPQVAFEILSQSNKTAKGRTQMAEKLKFYERYGIEEYYIYDPDKLTLEGYLRSPKNTLDPIRVMSNWISPQLGIRFDWQPQRDLTLYHPTGDRFLTPLEIDAENRRLTYRANSAQLRADSAELQLESTKSQLEEGARRLIALGMPIAQIAEILNMAIEDLRDLK
jgi:Uma2 family endonuclease